MARTHAGGGAGSTGQGQGFLATPSSKRGRWSMWLAVAFIALFAVNSFVFMPTSDVANPTMETMRRVVLPFFGIGMMLCGLAAGVVGLIGIIKDRERSWIVWLTLLPGAFVAFFLLGEILVPH
ncbi:MAG: hypothetical protein OEV43_09145 [Coriobacteriia bacterium]|nr:hypothetical protein [Coriobacteriia bacterium]